MPALPRKPNLGLAIVTQIGDDMPGAARDLRYFGGRAVGHDETPVDNLAALTAAIEWSSHTGGEIVLPAGLTGIEGTATLLSYATLRGASEHNTIVRQLSVPHGEAEGWIDTLVTPPASEGGAYGISLSLFQVSGGWNKKGWYGAKVPNWEFDPARMIAAGIRLDSPFSGPSGPSIRAAQGNPSDSHHRMHRIRVADVAGDGIVMTGRGEMRIESFDIESCARYGLELASPDNWITNGTIFKTGDSGFHCVSGNQRISDIKTWFCGMRRSAEPVGAGFHIDGPGIRQIVVTNFSTQDTYGPGMILEGRGLLARGLIDHPGGGRVERQGHGWTGKRTVVRSCLDIRNLKNSCVEVTASGGELSVEPPHLAKISSSGADLNVLKLGIEGDTIRPDVTRVASQKHNGRYNEVWLGGELAYGRMTEADLANPAQSVNSGRFGAPSEVLLEDGRKAVRRGDGRWTVLAEAGIISPVDGMETPTGADH